jgi:5-oxoprolinase (ATP-hydrolysing)
MLEVFNNLFMNIAEQMGLRLQNTALLGQHQGAAGLLLRAVRRRRPADRQRAAHAGAPGLDEREHQDRDRAQPGDARATSSCSTTRTTAARTCRTSPWSPRCSWTVVLRPAFYVASRGHHATSAASRRAPCRRSRPAIDEEGVLIDNFQLVLTRSGRPRGLREAELLALLASGPWPARNPAQNLADLRAQIAANEKGVQELQAMVAQFGRDTVAAYMRHVQDNAEEACAA